MLRVVRCRGNDGVVNASLAELYNPCRSTDIMWSMRRVDVENVELMFKSTWFDPRSSL